MVGLRIMMSGLGFSLSVIVESTVGHKWKVSYWPVIESVVVKYRLVSYVDMEMVLVEIVEECTSL